MKFYNNIDLLKNEIQNFRVQNLAAAPSNPVVGQHYFNTVDHTEYVYNGTKWIDALSQGDYTFAAGITEDENRRVTLDIATASAIGGVKIGTNVDVAADGTISVKDATNAQKGLIQLATDAEAAAGTDEAKAINAKQLAAAIDGDIELTDLSIEAASANYLKYDNTKGEFGAKVDTAVAKDSTNLVTSGAVEALVSKTKQDLEKEIEDLTDDAVLDVAMKENSKDTIVVTKGDDSTVDLKIEKVDEAVKATKDGANNVIVDTYATKTALGTETSSRTSADETLQQNIDAVEDNSIVSAVLKTNTTDTITITKGDETTADLKISKVDAAVLADKATADAAGNNIASTYATKAELDAVNDDAVVGVELKASTKDTIVVTKGDDTTTDIKIEKVDEAVKATKDGADNVITATYATKTEVANDITLTDLSIKTDSTNYLSYDNTNGQFGAKVDTAVTEDSTNLITSGAVEAAVKSVNDGAVVDVKLASGQTDIIQVKKGDNTTTNFKIAQVDKAIGDQDGNNIKTTYATKAEVADDITLEDLSATGPILYNNETGVISADLDTVPTNNSTKLVNSGAIKAALDDKVDTSLLGAKNGVAQLDENGLVPAAQLPSYVDDVIDLVAIQAAAPATCAKGDVYFNTTDNKIYTATGANTWGTGVAVETGKIYVCDEMAYRWSGSAMVQIGADKLKGYNGTIAGDGTTTTFTIEHNLGTRNVVCEIYDAATYEKVYINLIHTSNTAVQAIFSVAPATGENFVITILAIG